MTKKKKILVCGGTGFIGKNLVEKFSADESYSVKATYLKSPPPKMNNVEWVKADLTDPRQVEEILNNIDIVLQAAASTSGAEDIINRPYLHVTDNAIMNSVLFRAIHESCVKKVIFLSCSVMYSSLGEERPVRESDLDMNKEIPHKYFGVGWTKLYLEKMCDFYSKIGDKEYTVLRHSNIYGPYDKFDRKDSHVCAAMISKILNAQNSIEVWGDGTEKRDLLHVEDLVEAAKLCLEKQEERFKIYNVGSGRLASVNELVRLIKKLANKENIKTNYNDQKTSIPYSICLDCEKIRQELGWKPHYTLKEGLIKTIKWYLRQRGERT